MIRVVFLDRNGVVIEHVDLLGEGSKMRILEGFAATTARSPSGRFRDDSCQQ